MRNLSIWLTSYNPDMNQKLEGLENCKKLKHLDLYDSPFTNFLPFKKLKSLEFLDVQENKIGWCFKKYDTTLDVPIIDIKES